MDKVRGENHQSLEFSEVSKPASDESGLILRPPVKVRWVRDDITQVIVAAAGMSHSAPIAPSRLPVMNAASVTKRGRRKSDPADQKETLAKFESGQRPIVRVKTTRAKKIRGEMSGMLRGRTVKRGPEKSVEEYTHKLREIFRRISNLYEQNTLEAHERIVILLHGLSISAPQRWEDIHNAGDLNLSTPTREQPNEFARCIADMIREEMGKAENPEQKLLLDLGAGRGVDAGCIADAGVNVIGVDISDAAVTMANQNLVSGGLGESGGKVIIAKGDFLQMLEGCVGQPIDYIYSHSALHYSPHMVLEQRIFPKIAEVLRTAAGKFCFAMKIGSSASADPKYQFRLATGNPYNPSIDRTHKIFRIYPETEEHIHAILRPSFNVDDSRLVDVEGYDRDGEVERFCQIVASPKK
ncbi:class I SAM-dependent methyltransferase [Patescibacteria group bacterium]|nr:class I SAM-dependent methyltransferase [Patescibacteria group bacterium]MBU1684658.1 class I SAM-dependent methyltransferase [Patescibacteria group bacterium]MBU1938434.1 class I SAM-dependent methyltransferase [Patescibacteria group bacterium]